MTWDEIKAMHAGVSHDAVDPDEYAAAMHNAFPAIVEWVEAMRAALHRTQWGDSDLRHRPKCPVCGGVAEDEGHRSGCIVALAIADKPLTEERRS